METHIRKNLIKYIKENIKEVSDIDITSIYNIINNEIKCKQKEDVDLNRHYKINYIDNNIHYVEKHHLIDIEKIIIQSLAFEECPELKMEKIVKELINKMLVAMDKKEIKNLSDFIDVRREIIIDQKCKDIVDSNSEYIFNNGFSKLECGVYQKIIKYPHLSILKGMLKKIGYELCSKTRSEFIDKKRHVYTLYTIKKNKDI